MLYVETRAKNVVIMFVLKLFCYKRNTCDKVIPCYSKLLRCDITQLSWHLIWKKKKKKKSYSKDTKKYRWTQVRGPDSVCRQSLFRDVYESTYNSSALDV